MWPICPLFLKINYWVCISEDSLLDASSDEAPINSLQTLFSHASVQGIGHILDTLHVCSEFQLTLIPVLNRRIRIPWIHYRFGSTPAYR